MTKKLFRVFTPHHTLSLLPQHAVLSQRQQHASLGIKGTERLLGV
jgi:hypothetical protein